MSDANRRRNAFALATIERAQEAGLDGPDLAAAVMSILAGMYAKTAAGDAARYEGLIATTVERLRAYPDAPPRSMDPAQLLSDDELAAYEALIRAACRWTKPQTNKVGPALDLIFAELRRLRAAR